MGYFGLRISLSRYDVSPVFRPKWNTNSDEEREKHGKAEVHRGADPDGGEAVGSRADGHRDGAEVGVSTYTIYSWKAKYGGVEPNEAARLHHLEDENNRLKKLVADLSLDREMLKALLTKNGLSS